jgi:hypothetical protein
MYKSLIVIFLFRQIICRWDSSATVTIHSISLFYRAGIELTTAGAGIDFERQTFFTRVKKEF